MTLISFFGVALPGYALVRSIWPESDWNLGGSVSTSAIQPLDLVVVGGYVALFVLNWKVLVARMAEATLQVPTVGGVLGGSFGFLLIAAVIPAVLFWRINLNEFFGLRWDQWKQALWIVPCFVLGMMLLLVVMNQLGWHSWVESNYGAKPQVMVKLLKETPNMALVAAIVFSAVIVAPIAEEIIFRGYIYPVVKRYTERWFAGLFSGLLFGVIHFNLMGLPQLALMGIVLVVLYELTGSLWVTIGCHAAFNGTTVGLVLLDRIYEFPGTP
ncbi:MAG: membrane protease YdiL (CAAX protease family) [Akkermansiaceae bacterium]|jgi:membrane protease YdiL (CAAX protease family)